MSEVRELPIKWDRHLTGGMVDVFSFFFTDDETGDPIDVSGSAYDFISQIRAKRGEADAVAALAEYTITHPTSNQARFELTVPHGLDRSLVWNIVVIRDSKPKPLFSGAITYEGATSRVVA